MTDFELFRRRFLRGGTALGVTSLLPWGVVGASESSPDLEKFVQPLPIPEVREPDGTKKGADYHNVTLQEFEKKVHPDLPPTTLWGFDGQVPGPVLKARRNERLKVEFDNSALPEDHLFEIDDLVHGTEPDDYDDYDGPVPDVRTVVHQHGLKVEEASDGQAAMWKAPDGTTGPRFVKDVHDLPNRQKRTTSTYHDHAMGIARLNNYAGLNGFYIIESEEERRLNLPSGEYDIPLMLQDKTFEEDGSLHYPDEFVANFAGDTAVINGAVWPFLEVEPRRYRFRLVNQSNGRTFALSLENGDGHDDGHGDEHDDVPTMYQIAPDHGFLEEVVSIGGHDDLESLVLAPFERAEIIVDFSGYAGETLTLTNDAAFPYKGGDNSHGGHDDAETEDGDEDDGMDHGDDKEFPELPELMQFQVADSVSEPDDSADPTTLDLPGHSGYNENAAKETRHMTLGMRMKMGEPNLHVLNEKASFEETDDYAKPQLGTTEIWELENTGHHSHPVHLHLVDFEVIGRGKDGTHEPAPNERGPKDVVRVDPEETVRILTQFDGFAGKYMWHCHVLEHEEHAMMRPFEVVTGNAGSGRGADESDRGADGSNRGANESDRDNAESNRQTR